MAERSSENRTSVLDNIDPATLNAVRRSIFLDLPVHTSCTRARHAVRPASTQINLSIKYLAGDQVVKEVPREPRERLVFAASILRSTANFLRQGSRIGPVMAEP
jgi:hypothetical protein